MTDTEPYGARHFLRNLDPEGASERRRRLIPLLNGQGLEKGAYADLDQFQLGGILVYKTLVLARSPSESRPPSVYRLVWSGRYYDVWQRPDAYPPILAHTPLGDAVQPGGVPACSEVMRLAALAGPRAGWPRRRASRRSSVDFAGVPLPAGWASDAGGHVFPTKGAGAIGEGLHGASHRPLRPVAGRLVQGAAAPVHRRKARRRRARPADGDRATSRSARPCSGRRPPARAPLRRRRPPPRERRRQFGLGPLDPEPRPRGRAGRLRAVGRGEDALRPQPRLDRGYWGRRDLDRDPRAERRGRVALAVGKGRWIPYTAVYETSKFLGLELGAHHWWMPIRLKARISAYPQYWQSGACEE